MKKTTALANIHYIFMVSKVISNGETSTVTVTTQGESSSQITKAFDTLAKALNPAADGDGQNSGAGG